MEEESDKDLVARCKAELPYKVDAYRMLLQRYEPVVYRSCLKMLGSVQDAEEACQDAFLQVFHKIHDFEGRSAFKTWLYRIVYNRCMDRRRQLARRNEKESELAEEAKAEADPSSEHTVQWEVKGKVHEAINSMRGDDRRLIILRHISGLSLEEISLVLEIGLSAAKMRLYRAQETFKEIYTKLDADEDDGAGHEELATGGAAK